MNNAPANNDAERRRSVQDSIDNSSIDSAASSVDVTDTKLDCRRLNDIDGQDAVEAGDEGADDRKLSPEEKKKGE
jgi:hypothetical protein